MSDVTGVISTRLGDAKLEAAFAGVLAALDLGPAAGLRLGVALLVEKHRAKSPVTTTDGDIGKEWARDFAVFRSVLGMQLALNFAIDHEPTRDRIATEIAADRGLVATIARAVELAVNVDDLLSAVTSAWLKENPGAEMPELPREDVVWMELKFGSVTVQQDRVSYVWGEADRADVVTRWHWHRRLIAEITETVPDYRELFHRCPEFGGWRLKSRPRLRPMTIDGVRTLEVGNPVTPPRSRAPARRPLPNPLQGKTMDGSDA